MTHITDEVVELKNLSVGEITERIKQKSPELARIENLDFFVDQALIQKFAFYNSVRETSPSSPGIPTIPRTTDEAATMFLKCFDKANKIVEDQSITGLGYRLENMGVVPNGLQETDKLLLKLYLAGLLFVYGDDAEAMIKGSVEFMGKDLNLNQIVRSINERINHYLQEVKGIKDQKLNDIKKEMDKVFDMSLTIVFLEISPDLKVTPTIESHEKTTRTREPIEAPPPPAPETVSPLPEPSDPVVREMIENVDEYKTNVDAWRLVNSGYLSHMRELIYLYNTTGLIISPEAIKKMKEEIDKISPRGEGVFGVVGLNKYHIEEALKYSVDYLKKIWGVENLVTGMETADEVRAIQRLVIALGIYDYINGKGEIKELFDGNTADILKGTYENGKINLEKINAVIDKIHNSIPEQQKFVIEATERVFTDSESQRQNVVALQRQIETNAKAGELLKYDAMQLRLLAGGMPLVFVSDDNVTYVVTDAMRNAIFKDIERLALNEINWTQFEEKYKDIYGGEVITWLEEYFVPDYYGSVRAQDGGHGEYSTIGGDTLIDSGYNLKGTELIKNNWAKAAKDLGKNWDGSFFQIAEHIYLNHNKFGIKKGSSDYIELENAMVFYSAVEGKTVEGLPNAIGEYNYSPQNDLYYSAGNLAEKWQDYFTQGFFVFTQMQGFTKIYGKDESGNLYELNTSNLFDTEWAKIEFVNKDKIAELLNDTNTLTRLSFAFSILGPGTVSYLYSKDPNWINNPENASTYAGWLESVEYRNKYGKLRRERGRIDDYFAGMKRLEAFAKAVPEELRMDPSQGLEQWDLILSRLRENNFDNDNFRAVANSFADGLEKLRTGGQLTRSSMLPFYYRFFKFDAKGNAVEIKRDVVEEELKLVFNRNVTNGFNPILTAGFLLTGLPYEEDYTKSIRNSQNPKENREYVMHFDPFLDPHRKDSRVQRGLALNRELGFGGILEVLEQENVKTQLVQDKDKKTWKMDNGVAISIDMSVLEIEVKDRNKRETVMAEIETQTILSVNGSGKDGNESFDMFTPNVKGATVELYVYVKDKKGNMVPMEGVTIEGNLDTDEFGRTSLRINLNQRNEKGELILKNGETYMFTGKSYREDLGSSNNEYIATIRLNSVGSLSPVPGKDSMAKWKPPIPIKTSSEIYVSTNQTISITDLDIDTMLEWFAYQGLSPSTRIDENGNTIYEITRGNDRFILTREAGGTERISIEGKTSEYLTNVYDEMFKDLISKRKTDEGRDMLIRLFVKKIENEDGTYNYLLTSLGEDCINDWNDYRNAVGLSSFENEDLYNTIFGFGGFEGTWIIEPDIIGNIAGMSPEEIRDFILKEELPEFTRFMYATLNFDISYIETTSDLVSTPTLINKMHVSGKLIKDLELGSVNITDLEIGVYVNTESHDLYLVTDVSELPESVRKYYEDHPDKFRYESITLYGSMGIELTEKIGVRGTAYSILGGGVIIDSNNETTVVENLYNVARESITEGKLPSYMGGQAMLGYLLFPNLRASVGGELGRAQIDENGFWVYGAMGGLNLYMNSIDVEFGASGTWHRAPDAPDNLNVNATTLIFTIDKPLEQGFLENVGMRLEYKMTEAYNQMNVIGSVRGRIANAEVEAGVGVIGIDSGEGYRWGHEISGQLDISYYVRESALWVASKWNGIFSQEARDRRKAERQKRREEKQK